MLKKLIKLTLACMLVCAICPLSQTKIKAASTKTELDVKQIGAIPIHKEVIKKSPQRRPGITMTPKYITIHNTGNRDYGADALMHHYLLYYTTDSETSWHFTVDDKEIYQHLPLNEVGYHAGDNGGQGNTQSIGIEICENADGEYAKAEHNAEKLVAQLLYEYQMDISQVVTHNYWSGKDCPHNLLNKDYGSVGWQTFLSNVQKELDILVVNHREDTSKRQKPLEIAQGTSVNLGVEYQQKANQYELLQKDPLHLSVSEAAMKNKKIYTGENNTIVNAYTVNATVLSNEGIELPTGTFSLDMLPKDIMVEWQSHEIITDSLQATREGTAIIYIRKGNGFARLFVQSLYQNQPVISSQNEMLTHSHVMSLFGVHDAPIEWKVENPEIVTIENNVIKGLKPGQTKVYAIINEVTITRDITVK